MEFCGEHTEVIKSLGRLEEGQENLQKTADDTNRIIRQLTENGYKRDQHEAIKEAEHLIEQKALKAGTSSSWQTLALVAACGTAGGWLIQSLLPPLFRALAGVIK